MTGQRATECGFLIHRGSNFPTLAFHGTRAEQESLVNSILTGFEQTCRCHPAHNHVGQVVEIHLCPPHEFINETDDPGRSIEWTMPVCYGGFGPHSYGALRATVSRADRMMFARRMRARWLAQEGLLQQCAACSEIYLDSVHRCGVREERRLPW